MSTIMLNSSCSIFSSYSILICLIAACFILSIIIILIIFTPFGGVFWSRGIGGEGRLRLGKNKKM